MDIKIGQEVVYCGCLATVKAIAIGALFKGTNASIVRRDLYVKIEGPKRTDYYIVPEGSKLAGGSFVETVNVER